MFCKKWVPRNFTKFTGKHLFRVFFLIKLLACNFIKKKTPAQVFSCEFFEISMNTFFHKTPLVVGSYIILSHLIFIQTPFFVFGLTYRAGSFLNLLHDSIYCRKYCHAADLEMIKFN